MFKRHEKCLKQSQLSWIQLREAKLSNSILTQISLAQKSQLREAQLSNSILTQIDLAQKGQLREDQLYNLILTLISFAQKSLESCPVLKLTYLVFDTIMFQILLSIL